MAAAAPLGKHWEQLGTVPPGVCAAFSSVASFFTVSHVSGISSIFPDTAPRTLSWGSPHGVRLGRVVRAGRWAVYLLFTVNGNMLTASH